MLVRMLDVERLKLLTAGVNAVSRKQDQSANARKLGEILAEHDGGATKIARLNRSNRIASLIQGAGNTLMGLGLTTHLAGATVAATALTSGAAPGHVVVGMSGAFIGAVAGAVGVKMTDAAAGYAARKLALAQELWGRASSAVAARRQEQAVL